MGKRKNENKEGKANKKAKVVENEANVELDEEEQEEINEMEEVEVQVTPSKKDKKNKKDKKKKTETIQDKPATEITSPSKSDKKKKDKTKQDASEPKSPELKSPAKASGDAETKSEKKKKKDKKKSKKDDKKEDTSAITKPDKAGDDEEDDGFVISGGTGGSFQLQGNKMKLSGAGSGGGGASSDNPPSKKLYVGGIPYSFKDKDLRELFGQYGTIEDVYIPEMPDSPGKIKGFAFITFSTVDEATNALEKNGYQCGVKALKVEFTSNDKGGNKGGKFGGGGGGGKFGGGGGKFGGAGSSGSKRGNTGPLDDNPPDGCDSLFCGNLSYKIQDNDVYSFFDGCDVQEIRYVEDKQTGQFKGSAFIQFSSKDSLIKAGKLNGQSLLDRPVYLDYAKPRGGR